MAAILATACPRCSGTLVRQADGEIGCLQCGWTGEPQAPRVDPYLRLIETTERVIAWLDQAEPRAKALAALRGRQLRNAQAALQQLKRRTRDDAPATHLVCRYCGNHVRSRAHREACKRQEG